MSGREFTKTYEALGLTPSLAKKLLTSHELKSNTLPGVLPHVFNSCTPLERGRQEVRSSRSFSAAYLDV